MNVLFEAPENAGEYTRWTSDQTGRTAWYKFFQKIPVFDARDPILPPALSAFLCKWEEKIAEYKKSYRESYPVKLAKIELIYEGEVYEIFPAAVGATYETDFMSDEPYTVSWDSLFEAYEREIREDLGARLGVEFCRYYGMLD